MHFLDKIKFMFFYYKNKKNNINIFAPASGNIVNIEDVPDSVFSKKILGDGIAIQPIGNKLVAPINGVIGKIFETNHAFSIKSDNGIELFVHFGIDTINLKGQGFHRIAVEGNHVNKGDIIIEYDLSFLDAKSKSTLITVVISNMDKFKKLVKMNGNTVVGKTIILVVYK